MYLFVGVFCQLQLCCSSDLAAQVATSLCIQPVHTELLLPCILLGLLNLLCQLSQSLCFAWNCFYSLTLVACMACASAAPLLDQFFWPNCHQFSAQRCFINCCIMSSTHLYAVSQFTHAYSELPDMIDITCRLSCKINACNQVCS